MSLQPHGWTRPDLLPAMDPLLVQFYRQYMQQVQNLTYPPAKLLLLPDIQDQLYRNFFDGPLKGPAAYQRKVLKHIISLIEKCIVDPDQDEVSDSLMEHIGYLSSLPSASSQSHSVQSAFKIQAATETQIITYILPEPLETRNPPRILVEESPNLLAAGSNVGLRTWEASLHLAQYLHSNPELIFNQTVLELGAGTGLVSLLCSGPLGAKHVLATDGLSHVVDGIEKNITRNRATGLFGGRKRCGVYVDNSGKLVALHGDESIVDEDNQDADRVQTIDATIDAEAERNIQQLSTNVSSLSRPPQVAVLDWGETSTDTLAEILSQGWQPESVANTDDSDVPPFNLILGADITYAPDVVPILAQLLSILILDLCSSPSTPSLLANGEGRTPCVALISATVRNKATLDVFRSSCAQYGLKVEDVPFDCGCQSNGGMKEQRGFFHEQGFPVVIMRVSAM